MKYIRPRQPEKPGHAFVFQLSPREKEALLVTLKLFPLLDNDHHHLSRAPKSTSKAEQEWLVEAMGQQRQEHKKRLGQMFANDRRFFAEDDAGAFQFTLTGEQMEWMLRVLNDIRVGSWVRLGRPQIENGRPPKPTPAQMRFVASLELSGYFQTVLLEAYR